MAQFKTWILLITVIITLVSCNNTDAPTVRLAHISWPGYESFSLAKSKDLYNNIHVKTYRPVNITQAILAFENDVTDVIAVTLNHAIEIQSRHTDPLVIIAVLDISAGGDVILAKENIQSVQDLKGMRLAMEPSTLGAYLVSRAVDSTEGVNLSQINIIPSEIENHYKLFTENRVDAIATYGTAKSSILKKEGHIIFDSNQIPNEIVDVLITRSSYAEKNNDALAELLRGYFSALEYSNKEPDKAIEEMAALEKISAQEYKELLSGIHIPNINENIQFLKMSDNSLQSSIDNLHKFLSDKKLIEDNNKIQLQITDRYIPKDTQ